MSVVNNEIVAGIDIGGTKIAVLLQSLDEKPISSFRLPTRTESAPEDLVEEVCSRIDLESRQVGSTIAAVAVGCPGPLDIEKGLVLSPTNLQNWIEFPLVDFLQKRLKAPTVLENDANSAAFGEYVFGAGKDYENILYVTISTGIGGALIIDGRLHHGFGENGGEIGHTIVKYDGRMCLCGTRGCLETIGSGKSIVRTARERLAQGGTSELSLLEESDFTTREIVKAVKREDALACSVWEEACRFLAIGIGNAITTFGPNAVIIGGGVAQAGDILFTPLKRNLLENVNMLPIDEVAILPASLGSDSGVIGAAKLAQRLAHRTRSASVT